MLEIRTCRVCGTAAHGIEVTVGEVNANRSNQSRRHVWPRRPTALGRCRSRRWCGALAAALEIEFTDACVPVCAGAGQIVLIGVPEGRAIGVKGRHSVVAPAPS